LKLSSPFDGALHQQVLNVIEHVVGIVFAQFHAVVYRGDRTDQVMTNARAKKLQHTNIYLLRHNSPPLSGESCPPKRNFGTRQRELSMLYQSDSVLTKSKFHVNCPLEIKG